jgi:hypothetical protein
MEKHMSFHNHNAFHLCRNRREQIACVGEAMRRLGEGCTASDIKNSLGIIQSTLDDLADEARAYAVAASTVQTRAVVQAQRAA